MSLKDLIRRLQAIDAMPPVDQVRQLGDLHDTVRADLADARAEAALRAHEAGVSQLELARVLGRSRAAVTTLIARARLRRREHDG